MAKVQIVLSSGAEIFADVETLRWQVDPSTGRIAEVRWSDPEHGEEVLEYVNPDEISAIVTVGR